MRAKPCRDLVPYKYIYFGNHRNIFVLGTKHIKVHKLQVKECQLARRKKNTRTRPFLQNLTKLFNFPLLEVLSLHHHIKK